MQGHTNETLASTRANRGFARSWLVFYSAVLVAMTTLDVGAQVAVSIPPECGTSGEFYRELEHLLADRAAEAHPTSLHISERDTRGQYTLRMQVRGEVRELTDPDCRALFGSAVVIAASSLRPAVAAPAASSPGADQPDLSALPADAGSYGFDSETGDEVWRGRAHLAGGVMLGVLPGVAPTLELGGSLERGRWGCLAAVSYLPERAAERDGRGVEVWAASTRLAGTYELFPTLRLAAGAAGYRLDGHGFGASETRGDAAWSTYAMFEASLVPLNRSQVRAEVTGLALMPVTRARFTILGFGDVYHAPGFAGGLALRVAWQPP